MRNRALYLLSAIGSILLLAGAPATQAAPTVPAGFEDTLVTAVSDPTAIAFVSASRMLITSQSGQLSVFQNTALTTALDLTIGDKICNSPDTERGLLGVAVDPNFAANKFIYLYYTFKKFGVCPAGQPTNAQNPVNRVSRFVLADNNTVDPATEVVLIDNMISPNGNHNGGDLHFGADGYLYISVGDGGADYAGDSGAGGANDASRDQFKLLGKILRITRDGAIPADNPFTGPGTAPCKTNGGTTAGNKCQETFAWGLRNPFRFAFKPGTSQLFINDVGQGAWEEIDQGQQGADYGWNCREGRHTNPSASSKCPSTTATLVDPIFEYAHGTNPAPSPFQDCNAITGGAFVPAGVWPATYTDSYLFADYSCGKIFKLVATNGQYSASEFITGMGTDSATSLMFGPYNATQALYYTTYAGGGQVRRIVYTPGLDPSLNKSRYLPLIRR